jgi:ATP-dependent helicase HrpA
VSRDAAESYVLQYPSDLPITARRLEIAQLIEANQVVVIAGETGSGKSTQIPKICLELGRGKAGMIAHTQPRRVAARSIAARLAAELKVDLGGLVGYSVRFDDVVDHTTRIRVLTDGLLLAELRNDPLLSRYDTIIIDEAHERSLNIDFLLGYLHRILPERPDLRVIITSATIDTARFSEHFSGPNGPAPVIEVTGRSYPVEVRYRPVQEGVDQVDAVCSAVEDLLPAEADLLVFMSGEREIHDAAEALRQKFGSEVEVVPLYARLSAAEQQRVFAAHDRPRVVLSTNVAETSITVPGVRAVVDTGLARISRYSRRLKVQRLPIEPISQASANQRAGRCGRLGPGVCVRLYEQEDFEGRARFSDPEILRTNLAAVMLQMASLGLGDVENFAFVDPPDRGAIRDGRALLQELGAWEMGNDSDGPRLTPLGRRLARLPVDPRLGRMVIEADRLGVVREVLVIAAALSLRDPRERPEDQRQKANEFHARFTVEGSDLLGYVALWDHLRHQQRERSSSSFRRMCRAEFVNYLRVREWQDLYSQLRRAAAGIGIRLEPHPVDKLGAVDKPGAVNLLERADQVHRAVLAGHLSHLGRRVEKQREYHGARGSKFVISPPSVMARSTATWVVAAELVETDRLRARAVATVSPRWAEELGAHLVARSYSEPVWDARRGVAMAAETVTLFGLVLSSGRMVTYGRVDRAVAREMFIRHGLVERDWPSRHQFLERNARTLSRIADLAQRMRRSAAFDSDSLLRFYSDRIPDEIVSARHFDRWWSRHRQSAPEHLTISDQALSEMGMDPNATPDEWVQGDLRLRLIYRYDPGSALDGITVQIPIGVLNQVSAKGMDWLVPGYRNELVETLIRSLPKAVRRELGPMAEVLETVTWELRDSGTPIAEVMQEQTVVRWLADRLGLAHVDNGALISQLPTHLRMKFLVLDPAGQVIDAGTDLAAIRSRQATAMREALIELTGFVEQQGLDHWAVGVIAPQVLGPGQEIGYPALIDEGRTVGLSLMASPKAQRRAHRSGIRRLLLSSVAPSRKALLAKVTSNEQLALAGTEFNLRDLAIDSSIAAVDRVLDDHGLVWDAEAYHHLEAEVRRTGPQIAADLFSAAIAVAAMAGGIMARCEVMTADTLRLTVEDARDHLKRLVRPGFVVAVGSRRLPDLARYVAGIEYRLDRLAGEIDRDHHRIAQVAPLEARYRKLMRFYGDGAGTGEAAKAKLEELGWTIEELRLAVFAQAVGARQGVSATKVDRLLSAWGF